jgi:hypothetical protein
MGTFIGMISSPPSSSSASSDAPAAFAFEAAGLAFFFEAAFFSGVAAAAADATAGCGTTAAREAADRPLLPAAPAFTVRGSPTAEPMTDKASV